MVLKLLLGARDDVKEGRRPVDRNIALGDIGGLKTPLVPFLPLRFPYVETRGDVMLDVWEVTSVRAGVWEMIEACVDKLDCTENCRGDVLGRLAACVERSRVGCGLASGIEGAIGAKSRVGTGVVVLSSAGGVANVLLGTVGNL
jgi:hypothetical protein